ncbi:MAG: hypothetical protein H6557_03550 [Lewinellaceae bacterium]|nr:hypothetical protein [Lewinellaceae bacterium]
MEYLLEEDLRQKLRDWKKEGPPKKGRNLHWGWWMLLLSASVGAGLFFFRPKLNLPAEPEPIIEEQQQPDPPPTSIPEIETPDFSSEPVAEDSPGQIKPEKPSAEPVPASPYLALADEFYDFQVQPDSQGFRGEAGQKEPSALDAGRLAFADRQYEDAIVELSKIGPEDGARVFELAQELLAHSYFKMGQFSKAVDFFRPFTDVAAGYPLLIKDWAEWHLLLNLLPNYATQKREVDRLLDIMVENSRHTYHREAVRLKVKMDAIR